jgi:folate-dependent phosphoribosylglycinamide formyltransferase PurN
MSSCLDLSLNRGQLDQIVRELRETHPQHAISFQTIVPALSPQYRRRLVSLGGRAVQSRVVHLLDTDASLRGAALKGIRQTRAADRRLYDARLGDRVTDRDRLMEYLPRIKSLYDDLYLDKYSRLNPHYTEAFFRMLIECDEFKPVAWFDGDELEAFNIQLVREGVVHWSVCGYDSRRAADKSLFRLVAAEDMYGSSESMIVNWGGGNAAFKRFRGAVPTMEYEIIFDSHLPRRRRVPWTVLREVRGARHEHAVRNSLAAQKLPVPARDASSIRTPGKQRIAIITSVPALVRPFICSDLESLGIEIPVAVLLAESGLRADRMALLPKTLARQARMNRTNRFMQLVNRIVYYRVTRGERTSDAARVLAEIVETLATKRLLVESTTANDLRVIDAIRRADCDMCIVVGADVLTASTIESVGIPIFNLHLSDPAFVRGMPPVFWEILDDRDSVRLTLHRLTAELDAGPVVAQRDVAIEWRDSLAITIEATRSAAGSGISSLLTEVIPSLRDTTGTLAPSCKGPLRTVPRVSETLRAQRICQRRYRSGGGRLT